MAAQFATLLREARARYGLTQAETADRIGRARTWVVDAERGRVVPADNETILQVATTFDLDPTRVFSAVLTDRADFDLTDDVPGYLFEWAAESVAADMITGVGGEVQRVRARRASEIEDVAHGVVESLFPEIIEFGEQIPILDLLSRISEAGEVAEVERRIVSEAYACGQDSPEGMTSYRAEDETVVVGLRSDVWRRAESGDGRARFTAAHEVAHGLLHWPELISSETSAGFMLRDTYCTPSQKLPPGVRIYESPEYQANVAAAALLMPLQGVRAYLRRMKAVGRDVGVEQLGKHFGVSTRAASIRLEKLLPALAN